MEAHQSDDTPAVRILVVDDEHQLLKILTRYLAKLGYQVVASSSTGDAWSQIEAAPESYSLALIDATMSDPSATELTRRILDANPRIKVIVASGYPMTAEDFAPLDSSRVTFLHKPFSPDTLAELIRRLLSE
jgi:two-component system, cell cycle sensor histidine kinase and response regulator CckA